jgi:hypothetical protein
MKLGTQEAVISLNANTGAALSSYITGLSGVQMTSLFLQANHDITNRIYWGGASMTTANGMFLTTGNVANVTFDPIFGDKQQINPASVYLCADTAGNKCRIAYTLKD